MTMNPGRSDTPPAAAPVVEVSRLCRSVTADGGPLLHILEDVSFAIAPGEAVAIVGASGSGKSTLLHILGLHDSEWEGEYQFADTAVHKLGKSARSDLQKKNIGFIFQAYHLIDDLTVAENLEIPLSYRDVPRKERQSIVCDMLDRFNIVGKRDLFPSQLSGGQQQLVGVARALVANPKILLADEPTGNLHSDQAREIMELFCKLNQESGVTIVQVTHAVENADYGSRIVRLADGMLVNN